MFDTRFGRPSRLALCTLGAAVLAACGGGGGDTAPTSPPASGTPPPVQALSVQFGATSQIAAAQAPAEGSDGVVLVRNGATGTIDTAVVELADGTTALVTTDSQGRLTAIAIGEDRIAFENYTPGTVTVTWQPSDGVADTRVFSRATGAVVQGVVADRRVRILASVGSDEPAGGPTEAEGATEELAQQINDAVVQTMLGTFGLEKIADRLARVQQQLKALADKAESYVHKVDNALTCRGLATTACAGVVIDRIGQATEELVALDPEGKTSAGLEVTAAGVAPVRADWEPLLNDTALDLKFEMVDVPCEQSVFADMNPECPQYVPPPTVGEPGGEAPEAPAPVALDLLVETVAGQPVSKSLGHTGGETLAIVSLPAHGTVVLDDPVTGAFTYTPAPGYVGTDSFSFVATRTTPGGTTETSAPGVVTVTVQPSAAGCDERTFAGSPTTYQVVCPEHAETYSGDFAAVALFHRYESAVPGSPAEVSIQNNSLWMQIEKGVITSYGARYLQFDDKRRETREEERWVSYGIGGDGEKVLVESRYSLEIHGYEPGPDLTPLKPGVTSYNRISTVCVGGKATTKVYTTPLLLTPVSTDVSNDLSICESDAKVKAFAASFMKGGEMTEAYVQGSPVYRLATSGGN